MATNILINDGCSTEKYPFFKCSFLKTEILYFSNLAKFFLKNVQSIEQRFIRALFTPLLVN